jgi:hypothetical protein
VAILIVDVVGYSRLMNSDEEGTHARRRLGAIQPSAFVLCHGRAAPDPLPPSVIHLFLRCEIPY